MSLSLQLLGTIPGESEFPGESVELGSARSAVQALPSMPISHSRVGLIGSG